jgi:hypothetical protein
MEEKVVKTLNWYYYGTMVLALIALVVIYYMLSRGVFEPLDPQSEAGSTLQFAVIIVALMTIPLGLYLIKWKKPQTLEKYQELATARILMIGLVMPASIIIYYYLGAYRPMMWVAAIAAVAWYFTKPTLGKLEQEMKPKDPNAEDY